MFYLTTHSTHFIYGYMASDIWLRTILIVRKETRCRHIGYSYRLTARVLLYAPSHRQDNTYHGLCYTSRGALAGTRNSSMGPPHEGSIRRPIAPWANALPLSYVSLSHPGEIQGNGGYWQNVNMLDPTSTACHYYISHCSLSKQKVMLWLKNRCGNSIMLFLSGLNVFLICDVHIVCQLWIFKWTVWYQKLSTDAI